MSSYNKINLNIINNLHFSGSNQFFIPFTHYILLTEYIFKLNKIVFYFDTGQKFSVIYIIYINHSNPHNKLLLKKICNTL